MNIIKLNAIDSTNTYLKALAREMALKEDTVVLAENQIKGRGQRGNGWYSKKNESLTFSLFRRIRALSASSHFDISIAVSLALQEAFGDLELPNVQIKWPNDILADRKKVAGILIENTLERNKIAYSVIGIGINVNNDKIPEVQNAGSLFTQSGKKHASYEVFRKTVDRCFHYLNLCDGEGHKTYLRKIYEDQLFRINEWSTFEDNKGKRTMGMIKGIDDSGQLIIETEDMVRKQIQVKELKLLY